MAKRSVCACVSKRHLIILSSIRRDENVESNGIEGEGSLIRSLFGMKPQMSDLLLLTLELQIIEAYLSYTFRGTILVVV